MSSYIGASFGMQMLIDAHQRYHRAGGPVYLRLRNFPDLQNVEFAQLGFSITPTGTSNVGTTDVLIDPPPSVIMAGQSNIGIQGGKLRFGGRSFLVSATFVQAQMRARGLSNGELVFRDASVVGLYTDGKLFSIEDIGYEHLAGQVVSYVLRCNALEKK
jgi:hypothetical protein